MTRKEKEMYTEEVVGKEELQKAIEIVNIMKEKKLTYEEAVVLYNKTRKLSEWQ
jgi:hypothetical protein